MDENRIDGAATRLGGEIKSGVGDTFGDTKLSGEGRYDQARGAGQNALGGIADTLRGVFGGGSGSTGSGYGSGSGFGGAGSGLRDTAGKVGAFAQRNPVLAVLAAGAVASFLGKRMTTRRRDY